MYIRGMFFRILVVLALLWGTSGACLAQLSLDSCISLAMEGNLDVRRNRLQVREAELDRQAAYLGLLPDLNAGLTFGNGIGRSIDPTTNLFNNTNIRSLLPFVRSNLRIFQGLQLLRRIKSAKLGVEVQDAALAAQVNQLVLQVVAQYLGVLMGEERVKNMSTALESAQQQLLRVERMVEAKISNNAALMDARVEEANAEVRLVGEENRLRLAQLALRQLLLLPNEVPLRLDTLSFSNADMARAFMGNSGDGGDDFSVGIEEIYAQASAIDPRIAQAGLALRQAALEVRIMRGGYYPSLNLDLSARSNYSSAARRVGANTAGTPILLPSESFGSELSRQWEENLTISLNLTLQVPIFNRFNTRTQVKKTLLRHTQRQIDLQQAQNKLRSDIEQAYNDVVAAQRSYSANQRRVQTAKGAAEAATQRFDLQSISQIDYQVILNNYTQAQNDELNAKYQLLFNSKILSFYQNGSIE